MGSLPFVHHPPVHYAPPVTELVLFYDGESRKKIVQVKRLGFANNMHPLGLRSTNGDPKMVQ